MSIIDVIDSYGKYENVRVAHRYRESVMTYRQLMEKSDELASYIIEKFNKDNTPVVVCGHKQHEMLICFIACVKSGHAYIPLDSSLPVERIRDIIENSGTRMILSVGTLTASVEERTNVINIDEIHSLISQYKGRKPDESFRVKPEDTYYIIYTSGSTGKPKGVKITLSCLESFAAWGVKICNLDNAIAHVFLNQAPFSFDLSVMDLYISLSSGSMLFSIDKEMTANLKELFHYFGKSGLTHWVSTPSFAEMCLADKSFNEQLLPDLELLLFCGEILNSSCAKKLLERFERARVVNLYGPTEATVAVTSVDIDYELCTAPQPLPVGRVKEGCKIFIVDQAGSEVPDGEKGEILIAGDSVSTGYYKNIEMTQKVFSKLVIDGIEKRCYKTGDEGYMIKGLLHYCGRMDFQVKLNGYRIELEDIENNLRNIDFIEKAVVLPVYKNDKIQYLAAAVILNRVVEDTDFKIGIVIKNELKKFLPEYMIPRKIVIKDTLTMTPNGKVDRKALMEGIK